MRSPLRLVGALTVASSLWFGVEAPADQAPISGTVKQVDTAAGTLVVERTVKGKTRDVVIYLRPDSRIARVKSGASEEPGALGDVKPGQTVSVKTKHQGGKEVAELVRVVHEK